MKKGTLLIWKHSGLPAYEKLSDNDWSWWVSLDSAFLVETKDDKGNFDHHDIHQESEKPLYNKEGKLNRFGFRITDEQVKNNYLDIMFLNNTKQTQ